jgi:hydrogenase assembly chaperone HypC/HupF
MCLVLPSRVLSVAGDEVEIEMPGGMRGTASLSLCPDVEVGQYVMVDRGFVLQVIEPAEAEAIVAMYEEIGQLFDEQDATLLAWANEGDHG